VIVVRKVVNVLYVQTVCRLIWETCGTYLINPHPAIVRPGIPASKWCNVRFCW
jgi:hypothetical protein